MRKVITFTTVASLCMGPMASTAAMAQAPTREAPQARPAPEAKPAPRPLKLPPAATRPRPPQTTRPAPPVNARPPVLRPTPLPQPLPAPRPPRPPGNGWGSNNGGNGGGNWGGSGGNWGGGWGDNWNDWHGRIVRCESWNYRYARCNLDTRGGVRLVRVRGGDCRQGRSWGWDSRQNFVWVNRGCRADFQGRYGSWGGGNNRPDNTGAVIAGVAVAAGLIAILASSGRKADTGAASVQPASIAIGPGAVPAAAEASFRLCLNEAARQIGATGGTGIRLAGTVDTEPGNGGWRFQMPLESSWPGDTHPTPAFCRATSTQVVELSFYQG